MKVEKLVDSFNFVQSIIVTIEGKEVVFQKGDDKFELIIKTLKEITENSHEMPAFGVSIDGLTREEKKSGVWIELCYKEVNSYEAMDFESLLINVEKDWHGFNLIRKNNEKYDGRCFYLSLQNSMDKLYDVVLGVCKS